uniref:GTP cyclohydrolase 1 feedback regulatory protein n=1 Tax=Ditylenchus dipsaci TaxID=166011 RepID=A0A915DCD2_9BILA
MDFVLVSAKSLWKGPTKLSSTNRDIDNALDVKLKPPRPFFSGEIKYVTENSPTIVLNTLSGLGYNILGMTSSTTKELQYPICVDTR